MGGREMTGKETKTAYANKGAKYGMPVLIFVMIGLLIVIVCLMTGGLSGITASANSAFQEALEENRQEAYDKFYEASFKNAEEKNHVSNDVAITVKDIREEAQLEVLYVNDIEYIMDDENGRTVWSSFAGHGVYTVNLMLSEFIVDSERQYVLARVPEPQLSICDLDGEYKNYLYEDGKMWNGSIGEGVDLSVEHRRKALDMMQTKLITTQSYYESAENSARELISNIIKNLNPEIPELTVEVEFVNW